MIKINSVHWDRSSLVFDINNRIFNYYISLKEVHELNKTGSTIDVFRREDAEEFDEIKAIYEYVDKLENK